VGKAVVLDIDISGMLIYMNLLKGGITMQKKNKKSKPIVINAGTKRDVLDLVQPVHMCSNCWQGC